MGRGGKRPGAGRPKKPMAEKILEGNPGKRKISVLTFPEIHEEDTLPVPPEFLEEVIKGNAGFMSADEIFKRVTEWIVKTGCLRLITPDHITEYSLLKARWLECESMNAKHGLLAKHPVSGQPIASPYVRMGIDYLKAADNVWSKMWAVISQNTQQDYRGSVTPHDDVMERLLTMKPGDKLK